MKPWERAALVSSFVLTSALGVSFGFWCWFERGLDGEALVRLVLFVAIMAIVHLVAVKAYVAQKAAATMPSSPADSGVLSMPATTGFLSLVSPLYKRAIEAAVLQQVVLLVLSSLILDCGRTFRVCWVAAIAHWIAIGTIIVRRPLSPTGLDLGVIRFGMVAALIIVGYLAPFVLSFVER